MLAFAVLRIIGGVTVARPTFIAALSVHVPQARQDVTTGVMTDIASPVLAGLIPGSGLNDLRIGTSGAIALTDVFVARLPLSQADPESRRPGA